MTERTLSTTKQPAPGRAGQQHLAVLLVSCLALAAVVSAVASLNVAIPSIARETHATATELAWIIDAYALVFAALLLPGGALGDRFGRRRLLLVGLALYAGGSLAAMLYADVTWLIGMRAVLGVGAALVMPATLSTLTTTFPPEQRARAVGAWAGVAGASAMLGLLSSGLVLEVWSWRAVFGVNVVLALAAIVGTLRFVPESADPQAPRLDIIGTIVSTVGLAVLVYSIIEAPTQGWSSARTVAGIGVGALVLVGFVIWGLRGRNVLLDPRLFTRKAFSAGSLTITMQFFAFFGFIFLFLQYLQLVLGRSPLEAALSMFPMALGLMPAARVMAPRLVQHLGTARTSAVGLLIASTSLVWLSFLDGGSSYWQMLAGLVPLGMGMGLAMTPATSAITDALPSSQQGVGSAVNDLARELGGALGIAVLGSVLLSTYRSHLDTGMLPASVADKAKESLAVASRIDPAVAQSARVAFTDGLQVALLLGAGSLLVTAVAVLWLQRGDASGGPAEASTAHRTDADAPVSR